LRVSGGRGAAAGAASDAHGAMEWRQ